MSLVVGRNNNSFFGGGHLEIQYGRHPKTMLVNISSRGRIRIDLTILDFKMVGMQNQNNENDINAAQMEGCRNN